MKETDHEITAVEESSYQKVYPTNEELQTLRRISGKIPWTAFTVAFVELCERFSYYGTVAVFINFIQQPLPRGSTTGAGYGVTVPGAFGMGQRASTGLSLFNQFWAYIMPLVGAYIADQYWGRFRTIIASIAVALIGHTILVTSIIPGIPYRHFKSPRFHSMFHDWPGHHGGWNGWFQVSLDAKGQPSPGKDHF
ncbi:hypothetical protein V8E54_006456 [Elaphomyces granulatus]